MLYVVDFNGEVLDILDDSKESSCGGWNGHCGGCDKCLIMQVYHSISQGSEIRVLSEDEYNALL